MHNRATLTGPAQAVPCRAARAAATLVSNREWSPIRIAHSVYNLCETPTAVWCGGGGPKAHAAVRPACGEGNLGSGNIKLAETNEGSDRPLVSRDAS